MKLINADAAFDALDEKIPPDARMEPNGSQCSMSAHAVAKQPGMIRRIAPSVEREWISRQWRRRKVYENYRFRAARERDSFLSRKG